MKFSKIETIVILFLVVILIVSIVLAPKGSYIDTNKNGTEPVSDPVEITPPEEGSLPSETESEDELPSEESTSEETVAVNTDVEQEIQPYKQTEDEWGLTLSVEDASNGVVYYFTQNGGSPDGELMYGSDYTVEKLIDGEWVKVDYIVPEDTVAWTMEAYTIPMGSSTEKKEVSFEHLYGELASGVYRFGKSVMDFRQTGDFDVKMYYAEFDIN